MEEVEWILFYVYPARFNTHFLIVALKPFTTISFIKSQNIF